MWSKHQDANIKVHAKVKVKRLPCTSPHEGVREGVKEMGLAKGDALVWHLQTGDELDRLRSTDVWPTLHPAVAGGVLGGWGEGWGGGGGSYCSCNGCSRLQDLARSVFIMCVCVCVFGCRLPALISYRPDQQC